mmetsp:Transcript_55373/g.121555  ORF Transcript_55373/g.121555 Transcript_55373/m.121555 type:complete len:416 (+) Transcript_55373:830-2077(+)
MLVTRREVPSTSLTSMPRVTKPSSFRSSTLTKSNWRATGELPFPPVAVVVPLVGVGSHNLGKMGVALMSQSSEAAAPCESRHSAKCSRLRPGEGFGVSEAVVEAEGKALAKDSTAGLDEAAALQEVGGGGAMAVSDRVAPTSSLSIAPARGGVQKVFWPPVEAGSSQSKLGGSHNKAASPEPLGRHCAGVTGRGVCEAWRALRSQDQAPLGSLLLPGVGSIPSSLATSEAEVEATEGEGERRSPMLLPPPCPAEAPPAVARPPATSLPWRCGKARRTSRISLTTSSNFEVTSNKAPRIFWFSATSAACRSCSLLTELVTSCCWSCSLLISTLPRRHNDSSFCDSFASISDMMRFFRASISAGLAPPRPSQGLATRPSRPGFATMGSVSSTISATSKRQPMGAPPKLNTGPLLSPA